MFHKDFKPFNEYIQEPEPERSKPERSESEKAHTTITAMSLDDRPREKLMARGAGALTNAELLAILIGSGNTRQTAVELMQEVLNTCQGRLSELSKMTFDQLQAYDGIGPAKALTIIATAELGRRRAAEKLTDLPRFTDSKEIWTYMVPYVQDLTNEASWVMLFNNDMRLIRLVRLSSGGMTETLVDVRMVMKEIILGNATCFVLIHNHPSGNINPSRADQDITNRMSHAAQVMNVRMIDHIIVAQDDYYSFAESGKL